MHLRGIVSNPENLRKFHAFMFAFWAANIPPVVMLYFVLGSVQFQSDMLLYLTLISIITLMLGDLQGWQTARVEVKQEPSDDSSNPDTQG